MPVSAVQPRQLLIDTPLGRDAFTLVGFSGHEAISSLFHFDLDLVSPNSAVPFEQVVGQPVTVTLALPSAAERHFNGIVSRFSAGNRDATGTAYHAEVVPRLWLLTRATNSRVFQRMTVPEIIRRVLEPTAVEASFELEASYFARDYCVQYNETDFDFISRVMEEEGIYYFFKHEADGHVLVVADGPQASSSAGTFVFDRGGSHAQDRVFEWEKTQELRSGKVTLRDHEFELPQSPIEASATIPETVQAGQVTHRLRVGGNERLELYDYPGGWAERFDGVGPGGEDRRGDLVKIFDAAAQTAEIRMQEEAEQSLVIVGGSTVRALESGRTFTLRGHFNADGQYLITGVQHTATQSGKFEYANSFSCIPESVRFRPRRVTRRPVVAGAQTAIVVGPAGEEIYTDKYGRVKVQFFWDREGKKDEQSSCWIRVSQPVGGKGHGFFWFPEVGDEVVVGFEEGDPDRPLIIGRVYNADDVPPRPT